MSRQAAHPDLALAGAADTLHGPFVPDRRAVNLRSVLLGLAGVIFIAAITPYNDLVVNNTFFIGNFLPIGLIFFFLVLVILINAPLRLLFPSAAFTGEELAVAMGMVLVGCSVPGNGLMRFLPGTLVANWYYAGGEFEAAEGLRRMIKGGGLPDWMFPRFQSSDVLQRSADPVIQQYYNRIPLQDSTFISRFMAVPWSAWLRPAITWGILLSCIWGMFMCLMVIVRRQWAENERLPFPLASVYSSLVETPAAGKALNTLFCSRSFWVAAVAVFAMHSINALHQYNEKWPEIPLKFDFTGLLVNEPWKYLNNYMKEAKVMFCIVGITFFIQTKIAFSLWFFMLLWQATKMGYGMAGMEWQKNVEKDQIWGMLIAYTISILWIGRHHWMAVLRQMLGRRAAGEPRGRYLPYVAAGWGLVLCSVGAGAWLCMAGATVIGAVVLLSIVVMLLLCLTRVVAETGLIFVQFPVATTSLWEAGVRSMPAGYSFKTGAVSYFFTLMFHTLFVNEPREAMPVFTAHAMRVADTQIYDRAPRSWRGPLAFLLCLVLALAVAYVVSGASLLYCEYSYATTLDRTQDTPINRYTMQRVGHLTGQFAYRYDVDKPQWPFTHSRLGHFFFGMGLTAFLSYMRLHFVNWPLHPVGYLMVYGDPMRSMWFSIMIAWMAKVLILRFGGAKMFRAARSFFIGLILGEAGAAAFWLAVALARVSMGMDYRAIRLLPES